MDIDLTRQRIEQNEQAEFERMLREHIELAQEDRLRSIRIETRLVRMMRAFGLDNEGNKIAK
jgi:hypothetical protein